MNRFSGCGCYALARCTTFLYKSVGATVFSPLILDQKYVRVVIAQHLCLNLDWQVSLHFVHLVCIVMHMVLIGIFLMIKDVEYLSYDCLASNIL